MGWSQMNRVWLRLHALLRRRQLDRDLEDEIAFHLAMREEQLRASGQPQAAGAAKSSCGNPAESQQADESKERTQSAGNSRLHVAHTRPKA
jgi:hypothetical protein